MNRKLSTFFCLLLSLQFSLFTFADEVTMSEAWNKAQPYMKEQSSMSRSMRRMSGISEEKSQSQPLYIFSRGEGEGFVIVSGDDCLPAIIGYTEGGDYDEENMPPALKAIIDHYAEAVVDAQARGVNRPYSSVTASSYDKDIPVLLTSHWHQNGPWNNLCPQRSDGGGRAVTGCVATAASQIAYYWRNEGLNGVSQYDTPTYDYGGAPVTSVIVKKGTPFEWNLMADRSTTSAGNAAMARLCVLMGTCAYLTYGSSTGGYIWNMQDVYQNQIGLTRGEYVEKNNYSQVAWEKMVISDLVQGRPILYSSYNKDKEGWDGHAYVVDGYKTSDNTFHINFGWGDGYDGYFTMAETTRSAMGGRPDDQQMVYKIYSPNMDRKFDVEIVGGALYQYLDNKITFGVTNNSSFTIDGLYLFYSKTKTLQSGTTLADAIGSYSGVISKGETVSGIASYYDVWQNTNGLYFIITDKNLSTLYVTETPVPVKASRSSLILHNVTIDNGGAEEKTFKYQGNEITAMVYKVESGSSMMMSANFSNDVTGRYSSTYCVPVITGVVSSIDADGNCEIVETQVERDSIFEPEEVKDIPFGFHQLKPGVLYKASIGAKVGNGIGPLLMSLNYDTERADTMAFFMLAGSDMIIEWDGSRVSISGTTFDKMEYLGIANDATVTSIDLRNSSAKIPTELTVPANPNAIVFSNQPLSQGYNVVVNGVCDELRLQQGYNYDPADNFRAVKASLHINGSPCTSTSYYWNTLILPFTVETPVGMLARYYKDDTKNTDASATVMQAGTPYVYLMTHNIEVIEAADVDVYSVAEMPVSIGYEGYIGTFSNIVTDGAQAISVGTS
ncbi:MAG: C10 family peptidase, partial [Prevotella sp.]|nr:C10 family peptidase [Prevotella sp.]